ncbi:MAG: hypothetical protein WAV83_00725 [Methanothrix sp.]|uniref:hypothetical protein n=1 Tax=Methanothrix sp. TaxID=90426 RepID=UPI003BB0FD3B
MREGSDLPAVEACEILERIERGEPVIYDHVAIEGDIDLSRLELPFITMRDPGISPVWPMSLPPA